MRGLLERISKKSGDEWGGSNSSPEVRFRIPGAHTPQPVSTLTYLLSAWVPVGAWNVCACVCVRACAWVCCTFVCVRAFVYTFMCERGPESVFLFIQTEQLKTTHQNERIAFHHTSNTPFRYGSNCTVKTVKRFIFTPEMRGKTYADVGKSWMSKSNQSAHYSMHAIHNQLSGWVGVQKSKKAGLLLVSFEASRCPWNAKESSEGKPLQLLTAPGAYWAVVLQHLISM